MAFFIICTALVLYLFYWENIKAPFLYVVDDLPTLGRYDPRSIKGVDTIILHHTGGNQTAREYAAQHIAQGWPGIGYHFFINADGETLQTNSLLAKSYHNSPDNTTTIGVAMQGNFNNTPPTFEQLQSLQKLSFYLSNNYGIKKLRGHNEEKQTQCPGRTVNLDEIRNLTGLRKY